MNHLFQIYITESPVSGLPQAIERVSLEMQQCFVDHRYSLWNDEGIRQFLRQHFDRDVQRASTAWFPLPIEVIWPVIACFTSWAAGMQI